MDLYAYAQIENLDEIAKQNGINVPRLRGYRLMRDEEKIPQEEIDKINSWFYELLIMSRPMFCPNSGCITYDSYTKDAMKYYLVYDEDGNAIDLKWELLSSKTKKRIKTMIRNQRALQRKQYEIFNKYVGRDDVLYIHARIGGGNWKYYDGESLIAEPWFLEVVDDSFDSTYCDIYARIKPIGK